MSRNLFYRSTLHMDAKMRVYKYFLMHCFVFIFDALFMSHKMLDKASHFSACLKSTTPEVKAGLLGICG